MSQLRHWVNIVEAAQAEPTSFHGLVVMLDDYQTFKAAQSEPPRFFFTEDAAKHRKRRFRYLLRVNISNGCPGGQLPDGSLVDADYMRDNGFDGSIDWSEYGGLFGVRPLDWSQVEFVEDQSPARPEPKFTTVPTGRPKLMTLYHGGKGAFDQLVPGDDGAIWLTADKDQAVYFAKCAGTGRSDRGGGRHILTVQVDVQGCLKINGRGRRIRQIDLPDKHGWTPDDIAEQKGLPGIVYMNVLDGLDADLEYGDVKPFTVVAIRDSAAIIKYISSEIVE